ncbi:MAG: hypothetical protein GY702_23350, partial [Desulfobulbaceae bacterium]|nr:hypothetical protein [Desulfobulbaceae bacterium]
PRTIELTPVNERLYPFPPKSYRYCYDTKSTINGYTVYQEESYKTYLCSQQDFVKIGDPKILREGTISGHTVYTDTGFYTAFEGFRAWSKKRSTLYLVNTGQTFKFGITRLVPETNVRATIGKRDFATNKQKTVYVDTSKEKSKWIQIHFESDISANPETLKKRGNTSQ